MSAQIKRKDDLSVLVLILFSISCNMLHAVLEHCMNVELP